jgi:hypothetical protein
MGFGEIKIMWLKPGEYQDLLIRCLKATGIDKIKKLFAVRFSELIKKSIS